MHPLTSLELCITLIARNVPKWLGSLGSDKNLVNHSFCMNAVAHSAAYLSSHCDEIVTYGRHSQYSDTGMFAREGKKSRTPLQLLFGVSRAQMVRLLPVYMSRSQCCRPGERVVSISMFCCFQHHDG